MGGGAAVSVQSMCSVHTQDLPAVTAQIRALRAAGCDIVRVAVPDMDAARAVSAIKEAVSIPVFAQGRMFDPEVAEQVLADGKRLCVPLCTAPRVMEDPRDYDARANLMWVGTLAHNGLAGCGLNVPGARDGDWTCHGMEHELSALDTSITHGAGLAVVFPAWMRYVWGEHPERFLTFAKEVFGIEPVDPEVDDLSDIDEDITPARAVADAVEAAIDELQDFFVSLGMPRTLGELGITEGDIDRLLEGLKVTRGERFGTFATLTLEDARAIYQSAL